MRAVARRTLTLSAPRKRSSHRASLRAAPARAMAAAAAELRLSGVSAPGSTGPLVFAGSKERLSGSGVADLLPPSVRPVWASLLDVAASGSGDLGGSASTWASDVAPPRKVVACVLPAPCSRHNAPSQPHALASLLASSLGGAPNNGGATVVVVAPAEHALASTAALARSLPLFSLKTTAASRAAAGGGDAAAAAGATPAAASVVTAHFITDDGSPALSPQQLLSLGFVADAVRLAARLVDMPPEQMNTSQLRKAAKDVASSLGPRVAVTEVVGTALRDGGFGGIWGVGRGAVDPPALVVLSFTPEVPDGQPAVAMVGKGIVFDTGGLSLKISGSMCGMKMDLGGAAACLGAFSAAVRLGCARPLHAILCCAENAIGPSSYRNDDVITLLSGKSVEINNTDAEGRLVLGDGVAFASQTLPNLGLLIDVATLTGAQMVATGKRHAGIVCSSESIEARAVAAGKRSGDLVHPLPYAPEFFRSEFASKVADLKNSVKDRSNAQSSCAAQFVAEHISPTWGPKEGADWLHVDMAGPAMSNERGTGYGVALLLALLELV